MKDSKIYDAYWLKGYILYPVESTHISFIFDNPSLFSITKEDILNIYKKFKEPFRFEGKARIETIKEVSLLGWIRIRHYRKPVNYWSIQTADYMKRKNSIDWFILHAIKCCNMNENDTLKIIGYADEQEIV